MEIIIHNFCCYDGEPRSFLFQHGKVSLLNGPSGKGKSTILEAVFWALYGKRRDIVPHRSKKNVRSEVTLQIDNIIVKRTNHPAVLQVMHGEAQMDGPIAQAFIDENFGSADVWKSTSYIDQKNACQLLTGTPASRIAILNRLAFKGEESPEYYIEKISEALQEAKITYNTLYTRDFVRIEELRVQLQGKTIPPEPPRRPDILKREYLSCQQFLENNRQEFEQQKVRRSKHEILSARIEELQEKLREMSTFQQYQEELAKLEEDLQKWTVCEKLQRLKEEFPTIPGNFETSCEDYQEDELRRQIGNCQRELGDLNVADLQVRLKMLNISLKENNLEERRLQDLDEEISRLNHDIAFYEQQARLQEKRHELEEMAGPYQEEELAAINLQQLAEYEQKYQHNVQLATKMSIKYDPQVLAQVRAQSEENLRKAHSDMRALQKHREWQKYYDEYMQLLPTVINKQASREQLFNYQKQEKEMDTVLFCPHCQKSLRMVNGTLNPSGVAIDARERESFRQFIAQYQHDVQVTEKLNTLHNLLTTLREEIPANFDAQYVMSIDLNKIIHDAETLKEIVYMPPPRRNLQQWRALSELSKLPLPELPKPPLLESCKLPPTATISDYIDIFMQQREKLLGQQAVMREKLVQRQNQLREREKLAGYEEILNKLRDWQEKLFAWASHWYSVNYTDHPDRNKEEIIILREKTRQNLLRQQEIHQQLQNLQRELGDVSFDQQFLEKFTLEERQLVKLQELYTQAHEATQLRNQFAELSEKIQSLNSAQARCTNIEKLRSRAIEVQSQYLQSLGNDVIRNTNQILRELFDDPISIEINLLHTVKKTQSVVSGIDWRIHYKGGVYENIGRFSGGEEKRVSLAVVLALQRMHNSRILFLDEVFSAVDIECQVKCLNFIQQTTALRNVVCVMVIHNETGDAIDEIVNID